MNLANIVPQKFGQYIHKLLFSICDIQCFIIVFLEWCTRSSRICDAHVEKNWEIMGSCKVYYMYWRNICSTTQSGSGTCKTYLEQIRVVLVPRQCSGTCITYVEQIKVVLVP